MSTGIRPSIAPAGTLAVTADYDIYEIDTSGGNVTVTLPDFKIAQTFLIVKITTDANTITLDPEATWDINGQADDANWLIPDSSIGAIFGWFFYAQPSGKHIRAL